jgi:hypothetical protein
LSQFLDHHTVCNRGLDWLSMVNPVFEIVKRMNAVNILFLILSEKINWRVITDTVGIIGFCLPSNIQILYFSLEED